MASRPRLAAIALLALACAVPRASIAQTADERASARMLAEQADKKLADNDLPGAIGLFAKAYSIVPAPTLRLAQGRAEAKLGKLIEAQQHMLEASRSQPQPGEPVTWAAARREAVTDAAAIDGRLAQLELEIVAPDGVTPTVTLDGKTLPASSLTVPRALDPTSHQIHAEGDGVRPVDTTFTVAEGEHKKLSLKLEAVAPPPPAAVPAPAASPPAEPAPAASPPSPAPEPEAPAGSTESGSLGWSITGFVVGGVSLIAGTALGISSMSEVSSIKQSCQGNSCPPYLQDKANDASTQGTISTVLFVVAGGGVLLGVLTLPHGSSPSASSPATVHLAVGPASIGALGSF